MSKLSEERKENEELRRDIQGWMNWTYYLPEGWRPKPMIEASRKLLGDSVRRRRVKVGVRGRASGNSRSGGFRRG